MAVLTLRMVPPVPRANLLVGKLLLLHQRDGAFAKDSSCEIAARRIFVVTVQQ
jgi:hypothetical protein